QQVVAEQAKIDGFDEANAVLIAEAAAEAAAVIFEKRIQDGYASFLDSLKRYRDGLPAGLMGDLSETARDLYNKFNLEDHELGKLGDLELPERGGERSRSGSPGNRERRHGAVNVLGEGPLRCLGAAIVVAKTVALGLTSVVVPEAVDPIGDDHREGMRDSLFG